MSFTKGPWTISKRTLANTDFIAYSTHDHPERFWRADIISADGVVAQPFGLTSIEAKANANLIAAAPDLLEACKAALEEAQARDEDLGCNCWPLLKVAIEKAEGKNP